MATLSNNDIAQAIYLELKGKTEADMEKSLKKVVQFLSRKKLLSKSTLVLDALERLVNKEDERVVARISTAISLNPESKKHITHTLGQRYKVKEVELVERVDERLIGGFKIQIDDEVIDLTLKNKIKKLQEHLTR
ncbi:MAG: F0F1 ATP synthase subunit delta [Candidatus Nomurabacteria bacterium]|nr:F0F1 ATP synthase subunit delta [Candidatus Nomurabacteria bacterium]